MGIEETMKEANKELGLLFKRDYFFYRFYDNETNTFVEIDANEDIWQEYGIFSTKAPSGRYKFINELQSYQDIPNSQWEFIGYNIMPEPVPNPYYTPDSVPKTQIMGRWKWVQKPEEVFKDGNALAGYLSKSYKDALTPTDRDELANQIISALKVKYGPLFNENMARSEGTDVWLGRAGIIIPPTKVSRGVVRLWHSNGDWYTSITLNPLYHFIPNFKILYEGIDHTDDVVLAEALPIPITLLNTTDIGKEEVTERVRWLVNGSLHHEDTTPYDHLSIKEAGLELQISEATTITLEVKVEGNPKTRTVEHHITPVVEGMEVTTIPGDMTVLPGTGDLVIGSVARGQEVFDVRQGIPTGEALYAHLNGDSYIAGYTPKTVEGTNIFVATISGSYEEEDGSETSFTRSINVSRSYRYQDIDNYYLYTINYAHIYNYALKDGKITLRPKNYQVTTSHSPGIILKHPTNKSTSVGKVTKGYNFMGKAQSMIDHYVTKDGQITINSKTITVPDPLPPVPKTKEETLYATGQIILSTLANKKDQPTRAELVYQLSYNINSTKPQTHTTHIAGNPVTVHTPVVCYPTITTQLKDVLTLRPQRDKTQLILGEAFTLRYPSTGQHLNIPGYGNRSYEKTTANKQVRFSFDVYTGDDDTGTFIPAGKWHDVKFITGTNTGTNTNTATYYLPSHNRETTTGQVQFRTLPINLTNLLAPHNFAYNKDIDAYKAVAEIPVELSGTISDFTIIGITDPAWQNHFKQAGSTFRAAHLPVMAGKNNQVGMADQAVKLGYKIRFSLETNGDMTGSDDILLITPSYYHIDEKGTRQPVDLYYETGQGFIKLGSDKDTMKNTMVLNDPARKITKEAIQNTVKVLSAQKRNNGLTEADYLNIFTGHYEKDLAYKDKLLLTEAQKLYIGTSSQSRGELPQTLILGARQKWYGEFYLPGQTVVVPKGVNLSTYARLKIGEAPFITKGYIAVNFDIRGYHNIKTLKDLEKVEAYNTYKTVDLGNAWSGEGYKTNIAGISIMEGDVVFYHVDRRASGHYR
jgi:hypothetical protein